MKRSLRLALRIGEAVAAVTLASAVVLGILLNLVGRWNLADFILSLQLLLVVEGLLIALAGAFMISGFGWISPGRAGLPYMKGSIPREQEKNPSLGAILTVAGLTLFFIGLLWLSIS